MTPPPAVSPAPPPRPPGRPSRLNPDTLKRLLDATRLGSTRAAAAHYAGIATATLYAWMRRGREQQRGEYREFAEALHAADADAELRLIARVHAAMNAGEWRAAAWMLERRFPKRWGARDRVQLSGAPERPVVFMLDIATPPGFTSSTLKQIEGHNHA